MGVELAAPTYHKSLTRSGSYRGDEEGLKTLAIMKRSSKSEAGCHKKGRSGLKNRSDTEVLPNQQKKITQFFCKTSDPKVLGCTDTGTSKYFTQSLKADPLKNSQSEIKAKLIYDVILSSDSDSEEGNENRVSSIRKEARTKCFNETDGQRQSKTGVINTSEANSLDDGSSRCHEILINEQIGHLQDAQSQSEDLTSAVGESKPPKCPVVNPDASADNPFSDSDEELLSQIDIDEVISSQSEQKKPKLQINMQLPTTPRKPTFNEAPSPSTSFKQTPVKLAKPKLNYLSPIRHLNKKSRSSRSLSSSSSQKSSPSPSKDKNKNGESPNKSLQYDRTPYYLKNFTFVVNSVVQDSHLENLLNSEDIQAVLSFKSLSPQAQCLYVRLFQRKWEWKSALSIKYPLISGNLEPVFQELHSSRFLIEINDEKPEMEELLDLLSGDQIQELSKQMRVDTSKKNKEVAKKALVDLSRNQHSLLGSTKEVIIKRSLKLLGKTYQLEKERRNLYSRFFIMYSPPQYWEDEQGQNSNQILKILLAENGQMVYPSYSISKLHKIYLGREDIIRFHDAWNLHSDIIGHLEAKNWDVVISIAEQSLKFLTGFLKTKEIQSHDESLPLFLRVYTAGSVLTRVCWLGVDGFQKEKQYSQSNKIVAFLLSQEMYLPHYRGRWYERLMINMKHLKESNLQIKSAMVRALSDEYLQDSHKLTLSDRLTKLNGESKSQAIKRNKKKSKHPEEEILVEEELSVDLFYVKNKLPEREIKGEKLNKFKNVGKSVFIGAKDSAGSSTASSVEDFAIEYYRDVLGYSYGLHAEGSSVTTIFGLLFWDEIYSDKFSDSFHTPYQAFPLDMHFEDFFERRKTILLEKLDLLRVHWALEDALLVMEQNWVNHLNKLSVVNWATFPSVEQAKSLVKAMGLQVTASICERLTRNFRHNRSGFPDLVLWNHDDKLIFVEVKGPGDTLSAKQVLWLDFLLSINVQAEVCHVTAVSNKRIRNEAYLDDD